MFFFNLSEKAKHSYTFKEIKTAFMQWLDWSYRERNKDQNLED